MEKNDWQDQKNNNGSDFMKVVQDAINSGDYQQLNEQVRKTVSASVQEGKRLTEKNTISVLTVIW